MTYKRFLHHFCSLLSVSCPPGTLLTIRLIAPPPNRFFPAVAAELSTVGFDRCLNVAAFIVGDQLSMLNGSHVPKLSLLILNHFFSSCFGLLSFI